MPRPPSSTSLRVALRVVALIHLCAVALQPVLAGQYFAGSAVAMSVHGPLGETVAWFGLVQALVASLLRVCGGCSTRMVLGCVAMFALDGLQVHAGHAGLLALHVPLGAGLLAASVVLNLSLLSHPDRRSAPDVQRR